MLQKTTEYKKDEKIVYLVLLNNQSIHDFLKTLNPGKTQNLTIWGEKPRKTYNLRSYEKNLEL